MDDMGFADSGSASRFFYCAKASKGERNAGLPEGMKNDHNMDGVNPAILSASSLKIEQEKLVTALRLEGGAARVCRKNDHPT
jgi:hypothetical protein